MRSFVCASEGVRHATTLCGARRAAAAFHAEAAERLAADLERHRRAKRAAQDAARPALRLTPPEAPHQQGRLPL